MRLIDADALDIFIEGAELEARKQRKYVLEKALNTIRGNIRNFPSVQSEQRWIPCSEKLPENGRQVLVFARSAHFALAKYDEMREADGKYKKQWVTFDAWKPFYTIKEVIAWMPLPKWTPLPKLYEKRRTDG